MTDTHCHLDACEDLSSAVDPELRAMITVGITRERSRKAVELAQTHPNVWAAVGIHPNHASDAADPATRSAVGELARHPRVVAIGETGFDTHWDKETLDAQSKAFRWHVEMASETGKPLILHVRDKQGAEDASQRAATFLREAGYGSGILHCCNGHDELIDTGLELGWYVSFAGNLTYKKATALHAAARRIPRERLLVETDSPYLAPVPKRGKPNIPSYVRHTAAFLAGLRGETLAEVEAYTDANAQRVYKLNL